MRGQDWITWLGRNSGASDYAASTWVGQLKSRIESGLPEPDAANWANLVKYGAISGGQARAKIANTAGHNIGRLWTTIGESIGYPLSEGVEAMRPLASALSFDGLCGISAGSFNGELGLGALSNLVQGQNVGRVMSELMVSATATAITNTAKSVPIAGVLVSLTEAYINWQLGALDNPQVNSPCSAITAAEISADADERAAEAVTGAFQGYSQNNLAGPPPNLTPLFMPPGQVFNLFKVNFQGLAASSSDPNCRDAWGSSPDQMGSFNAGYVAGTNNIHVGFQMTGTWTDPGSYLTTAASLCSQIWAQIQKPGPLMYTVEADVAAEAWIEYIAKAIQNIPSQKDWGGNYRSGIALWNALAAVVGMAPFRTWFKDDENGFFGYEPAAGNPLAGYQGFQRFRAIAATSECVKNLRLLRSLQGQNLRSRVMGYVTNDFVGLRGEFPEGIGVFVRDETAKLLAQSPTRCNLDRSNIVDPELAAAVATCPPGTALTTAAAGKIAGPLAPTDAPVKPPSTWSPTGQLAPVPSPSGSPGSALAALVAAAGLFWMMRR